MPQTPWVFASRMDNVRRSFIREILKVTADPSIISFAGGLPQPGLFPAAALAKAAESVIAGSGSESLQYSTTEGDPELRRFIAGRYKLRFGLDVDPDWIIITTGSQQALDLLAKAFLDPGDGVLVERPGYIGAIQLFSLFQAEFASVPLDDDGPDPEALGAALSGPAPKLFYSVPNFQNPSGITWSKARRELAAGLLADSPTILIEDDPYGELRFLGEHQTPLYALRPERTFLLGSFSKVVSPGLRVGWLVADPESRVKLVTAKQASDLHTSTLAQRILVRYLAENDLSAHVESIKSAYRRQRDLMVARIEELFPPEARCTRPEGGMFLWITLPDGVSAYDVFDAAIKEKVAFVPGGPFFVDGTGANTMRLNFSNSDEERIDVGMRRLAACLDKVLSRPSSCGAAS
ncbi:PLP-dependent aminotransferase family protein [Desulfovibrio sulfodismutans]|uniref:PLP-dependent aminotransferase family protein n=2 Tax=Desulfolutivibrio sulfodismutans TaxID=63561 RepID=A0A7K3NJL4_9BACT|nr:PLP-dependent aminotransferase family protein [Desulfolutivibrio sulfodismutans]QLA14439.1 aminotransferase class I/II-fold pyridoxal phosphate-dependent enzyme [Desulfolutivibrio sulfodismutans DSM 3696]